MKKTYILGLAILGGTMSFAQMQHALTTKAYNGPAVTSTTRPVVQNDERAALWEDDCSDVSTWTLSNANTGGATQNWAVVTDPALIPVTALSPFASTTAANGFFFFSSDAAGGPDADGTRHIVTAQSATTAACAGEPNLTLRFQHNYRWWQESRTVRVTANASAASPIWTEYKITIAGSGGFNGGQGFSSEEQNTGNPQFEAIDISAAAGNSADIAVQFVYDDNDFWGWYWAFDDVSISVTENNDLKVESNYFGTFTGWVNSSAYHSIPVLQVDTVSCMTSVKNVGLLDQTNVMVNFDVNGTTVSSPAILIEDDSTETITAKYVLPATVGEYAFTNFVISADVTDTDLTNNMVNNNDTINVVDFLYARDNNKVTRRYTNKPTTAGATGVNYEIGNMFVMFENQTTYGLGFVPHSTSTPGAKVKVMLYEYDLQVGYNAIFVANATETILDAIGDPIAESEEFYELTQADIDAGAQIDLVFENGAEELIAGQAYLAVVYADDETTSGGYFTCAAGGVSANAVSYFNGNFGNANNASKWWTIGTSPMVRINFDPILGVNNANELVSSLSAYPNPAANNVNVNFTVVEASNVAVTVVSLTGDVVYNNNLGVVAAGKYTENINTAKLANGVYFYTLTVNGNATTKKLVISKK